MKTHHAQRWIPALLIASACTQEAPEQSPSSQPAATTGPVWFEDVAAQRGIDFEHVRATEIRHWFPEIMGSGVAWLDFDADGWLDLYCIQGGDLAAEPGTNPPNRLFRNQGDGTFRDVTESAGVGDRGYGMGCATGDIDNDGDVDLYVSNVGPNTLYRNNGDGTFSDITSEAAVGSSGWGTSCAFVDYDRDGDLDLYATNNINWSSERELDCTSSYGERDYCSPKNFNAPAPDVLYRNDGTGSFTDVSAAAGIDVAFGNGLGVACGDYNSDGWSDFYIANDGMPNQLWINQTDGTFEDQALLAGCAVNMQGAAEAGMGVAAVDIDEDGDQDLFMTHLREETNTFYFNKNGYFDDATTRTGLSAASIQFTGFGTGFADFDHDGNLDLYVSNGRVGDWKPRFSQSEPYGEPDQLFQGQGGGKFKAVTPRGGVAHETYGTSRGAALGDFDNDGDIDVAVSDNNGKLRLLTNVVQQTGHWTMLDARDSHGKHALGSQLVIEAGGKQYHRQLQTAYSYCSANDPRVHVGLGEAGEVTSVSIVWPDGASEVFGPFAADQLHVITQGGGRAQ